MQLRDEITDKHDPYAVRSTAVDIVSDQPGGGGRGRPHVYQIAELHWFVNETISYVPDPVSSNYIAEPEETLETEAGDCDCQAVLLSSLLEAIGANTRIAYVQSRDGGGHVFTEVCLDNAVVHTDSVNQALLNFYYEKEDWWPDTIHQDYDSDCDWYLADTAMGRYIGDISQLAEGGYAEWLDETSWSWVNIEYYYP